jgi:hypothetical protein
MALYKYHYIELDTKRSPRISLQNIVAGETGNRLVITVTNNGEQIDMSEKSSGAFVYRVCLKIDSDLGTRRQDSATENSGITFIEANTGDHGKINILLSKDSFTAGKNRARLEIYSTRSEENDTLIVSAEWTFDVDGSDEGDNVGVATPLLVLYEKLAESWARGGTGVRDGENTDNAMYFKTLAEQAVQGGIIDPTFATWLTAHMSDFITAIGNNADEWLSEHITNPSNPPLDTSLSVSGAAADAKETGLAKQMIMLPFDLENEHYALECIHHDNFNRTPESEYDIGQNGNESVPMTYTFDTETNDSFKIVDNVLTHPSTTSTRCMYLTNKPNRNFAVTLGLVMPTSTTIWSSFFWNWTNARSFCEFRISRKIVNNKLAVTVYVTSKSSNVDTTLLQISSYGLTGNNVTLVFVNNNLYIYFDNTLAYTVYNIAYDKSKACGMFIRTPNADYRWKSVCVYNIDNAVMVDAGLDADKQDYGTLTGGNRINASITQALSGNVSESYDQLKRDGTVTRFSPYSERFELQYVDGDTPQAKNDSRRSEVAINQSPKNALFRALVSFDFCLPSDYQPETDPSLADDDFEIIAQFHYDSTGGVVALNPTPCLKIKNGDLWISQWGRPEPNTNVASSGEYAKVETALKTLTPGRWYHIDLFVRSGYESAHNPLVEVKIDGELVYRNTGLNCPNTVGKVVIHYGIYKSQWYYRLVGNVRTKTYYFDNMKVRWF